MRQQLLNLLLQVIPLLKQLKALKEGDQPNRVRLYRKAVYFLGTDASPNDVAPDEYGCAETVNAIHKAEFGVSVGGDVSTYRMYRALKNNRSFVKVDDPQPGDIVISPTGYGNGNLSNGHVGIVAMNDGIMSNSSVSGKWEKNYTLETWWSRYVERGGYPMAFFRKV